jgi:hypothetical protein
MIPEKPRIEQLDEEEAEHTIAVLDPEMVVLNFDEE